jgi:hypothetical protein
MTRSGPVTASGPQTASGPVAGAPAGPASTADPASTAGPAPSTGTVVGLTARQRWRRLRGPLLILMAMLSTALLIGLAQARVVRGELDPAAADPAGSRALATLLAQHGVQVRRVSTVNDAQASYPDTPVLVAFPNRLPAGELRRLAGSAARLILVAPDAPALREASADVLPTGSAEVSGRMPGCDYPAAVAAGDADLGGRSYRLRPEPGRLPGIRCYDGTLVVGSTINGSPLVALGSGTPLHNDALAHRGNAALALNLLGADGSARELRWLVPTAGSAAGDGRARLIDLVPRWVPPVALQLLVVGLLVVLWRARRLGPPVPEPLPVVVRAAETVEGRARLYRRGKARDRAAEALRAGTLARIVPRLRLGISPPPPSVVSAVAARSARPTSEVSALLYGDPPADDQALVRLADELDRLATAALRQ